MQLKSGLGNLKIYLKLYFTYYLIRTPQNLIYNFIKNFMKHSRLKKKINNNYSPKKNYLFTDNDWFFEKLPLFIEGFLKLTMTYEIELKKFWKLDLMKVEVQYFF